MAGTSLTGPGEQRSSALSRYLAKSSALHARPMTHSRSSSPVSASTTRSRPASAQSVPFAVCPKPLTSDDMKLRSNSVGSELPAETKVESPTSMPDSIPAAFVCHVIEESDLDSRSTIRCPLVLNAETEPSDAFPIVNTAPMKELRRTSTSERVLSFFSSFLKPPEAAAAEMDLIAQSEIRRDGQEEAKTSAETVPTHCTGDTHREIFKNMR